MNPELINKINWVDIFVIIIFLRTLYIGLRRGLVVEFFKLSGVFCASILSFHYFPHIGNFLNAKTPLPLDLADFIGLLFLSSLIILLFKFIREGFTAFIKTEVKTALDRWLGFIFSGLRAFILSSLILVILFFTNITYLQASIKNSFSQRFILNLAPRLYSSSFENLMVKFLPNEQLNTALFDRLEPPQTK